MARSHRTIREAKYVKVLTPTHIKKTVSKYQGPPFYPKKIEIIIPGRKHTKVPAETHECAKKKNVRIRRFWGFR